MFIFNHKFQYLAIVFIHLSIISFSQKDKYNFSFKETKLDVVIKEISNQSKVNILYNPGILPNTITISGNFKDLTINQALDTFLTKTQISYKRFKQDIILFKKNEKVKEMHHIVKPDIQKKITPEKNRETITDTVTVSIITYDTILTKLNDYVKVQVMDTIKVYDTVQVIKKVTKPVSGYLPKNKTLIAGLSFSQGIVFSTIQLSAPENDSLGTIKASMQGKQSSSFGLNLIYRNKTALFETGIYFSNVKYTFNYTHPETGFITVLDTTDKYYTSTSGTDTTWVYVTEERQVKQTIQKRYYSDLTYRYLSVPILFGYHTTLKNFTFEFKAGILCNFYIGSKGLHLNNLSGNEFTVDDSKAPNSFALLGAFGGLGIDYYVNKEIHIFGQPSFSWSALPIGKKNKAYYATDLLIGINFGARYYF